jgi:hypothetical protein
MGARDNKKPNQKIGFLVIRLKITRQLMYQHIQPVDLQVHLQSLYSLLQSKLGKMFHDQLHLDRMLGSRQHKQSVQQIVTLIKISSSFSPFKNILIPKIYDFIIYLVCWT